MTLAPCWRRRLGGDLIRLAARRGVPAQRADGAVVRVVDAAAERVCYDCAEAGGEGGGQRSEVGEQGGD
jgi:hypothetical protein